MTRKQEIRAVIIFWSAILIIGCYLKYDIGKVNTNAKYTIANTYNRRWTMKSGKFIDYNYEVCEKQYRGSHDVDRHPQTWDKFSRYLLAYDSLDHSDSYIFLKIEMPDSIEVPKNGWTIPPNNLINHPSVLEFKSRKWWAMYINPD